MSNRGEKGKMDSWYNTLEKDAQIFGRRCLKHKTTKEYCIFGKKGQIWQRTNHAFNVLTYGQNTTRKVSQLLGLEAPTIRPGEEYILSGHLSKLKEICTLIKVPRQVGRQVKYAKMFDKGEH
jgi:hypothetical protein